MNGLGILLFYLFILAVIITLIILEFKKKTIASALSLLGADIVAVIIAVVNLLVYNSRPGFGKAPGLTYFAETLFSLAAIPIYAFCFFFSVIIVCIHFYNSISKNYKGNR